jgi:hypothetical protein
MRFNALLLVILFVAAACTQIDPIRPQHIYEATATARAQVAELVAPPVTIEPAVLPTVECLVKANVSATGEKIFHVPGQANYGTVIIDPEHGEACFTTEGEAVQAGFRKALR